MKSLIVIIILVLITYYVTNNESKEHKTKKLEKIHKAEKTQKKVKKIHKAEKTQKKVKKKVIKEKRVQNSKHISTAQKIHQYKASKVSVFLKDIGYPTTLRIEGQRLYFIDEENKKIKYMDNGNISIIDLYQKSKLSGIKKPIIISKITSLCVDGQSMYMYDYWKNNVYLFTKEGEFEARLNKNSTLRTNKVSSIVKKDNGNIYLSDTFNHRIVEMRNGKFTVYTGSEKYGSLDGDLNIAKFNQPSKLLTYQNTLIVLDSGTGLVRHIENSRVLTIKNTKLENEISAICLDGDELYMYSEKVHQLYIYNMQTKKIKFVESSNLIDLNGVFDMAMYKNELVLSVPTKSKIYKLHIIQ